MRRDDPPWLQVMTGPGLAKLVETMVGALNSREIPTAGSILEHFNRDLVQKVRISGKLALLRHEGCHTILTAAPMEWI